MAAKEWALFERVGFAVGGLVARVVAAVLRVRVTSWWRDLGFYERNNLPPNPNSVHLVGGAIDFGRETPTWKLDALRVLGTVDLHKKGTGEHYHGVFGWRAVAVGGFIWFLVAGRFGKGKK